ncbi:MAG: pyruvoyl-dependent arginine decarboxylase [Euryarchaeota archaeon]|nr:pyruvoyl-dependent arginine decarboxylase [Euryarchaeota archaeon]
MDEQMVPKAFFVTSGMGMDAEQTNAFDLALRDAGIGECNLVEVSSILPANAVETERSSVTITPGNITFCVMSRADGKSGEIIGAGVGYGWLGVENENGEAEREFGIVCEHHGHCSRDYLAEKVHEKLYKMAEIRDKKLLKKELLVESSEVEKGKFGSVVVVLVFVF